MSADVRSTPCSRRNRAVAIARAVRSPSLTPPWNRAGIVRSRVSVTSVGRSTSICSTVGIVSAAGSNARIPMWGSSPVPSILCHTSTSAMRDGAVASSASRVVHSLIDVPTGANSAVLPDTICDQAVARSGMMIRHDTPSTAKWCATINNTPGRLLRRPRARNRTRRTGPSHQTPYRVFRGHRPTPRKRVR